MTYHVCLSLDHQKPWTEQQGPVVLKDGLTREDAAMLMERVAKDLQKEGLWVDRLPQRSAPALQVRQRRGDDLDYVGCIFYAPDQPRG